MRNPAVIAPSHMPRIKRTANRPPNEWHAACAHSATDQTKMLTLEIGEGLSIHMISQG